LTKHIDRRVNWTWWYGERRRFFQFPAAANETAAELLSHPPVDDL